MGSAKKLALRDNDKYLWVLYIELYSYFLKREETQSEGESW